MSRLDEHENLKCQIGTSSENSYGDYGNCADQGCH